MRSSGIAKVLWDLNESQTRLLMTALPRIRLADAFAATGILQDFSGTYARIAEAIALQLPIDELLSHAATAELSQYEARSNTEHATTLSRSQRRLLFADFVYCLVFSLLMLAAITMTGESAIDAQIFTLITFATGLGAHQVAKRIRDVAFRV